MLTKEKCCREINDSLQKTFARSILKDFAKNLNVDIFQGAGGVDKKKPMNVKSEEEIENEEREIAAMRDSDEASNKTEMDKLDELDEQGNCKACKLEEDKFKKNNKKKGQCDTCDKFEKKKQITDFKKAKKKKDVKTQVKILKSLAIETAQDRIMHKRQKNGQLRFGDVICLTYTQDIFNDPDETKTNNLHKALSKSKVTSNKTKRNLDEPDYVYKGILYSDGVTDRGIKIIPQKSNAVQNASNLFKQCLFRVEVMQNCDVNKREKNLQAQKHEFENKLKKMIKDKGGENNIRPEIVMQIKKDIELV